MMLAACQPSAPAETQPQLKDPATTPSTSTPDPTDPEPSNPDPSGGEPSSRVPGHTDHSKLENKGFFIAGSSESFGLPAAVTGDSIPGALYLYDSTSWERVLITEDTVLQYAWGWGWEYVWYMTDSFQFCRWDVQTQKSEQIHKIDGEPGFRYFHLFENVLYWVEDECRFMCMNTDTLEITKLCDHPDIYSYFLRIEDGVLSFTLNIVADGYENPNESVKGTLIDGVISLQDHCLEVGPFDGPNQAALDAYRWVPGRYTVAVHLEDTCWYEMRLEDLPHDCAANHLFVYNWNTKELLDVLDEPMVGEHAYQVTVDYIYYVKASEPNVVYRVSWDLKTHEKVWEFDGTVSDVGYHGIDPQGKLYVLLDNTRIVEADLKTRETKVLMEKYYIESFTANIGNDYEEIRQEDSGEYEKVYNVIWWYGRIDEGAQTESWYYLIDEGIDLP